MTYAPGHDNRGSADRDPVAFFQETFRTIERHTPIAMIERVRFARLLLSCCVQFGNAS